MSYAPLSTYREGDNSILGQFREKEFEHVFEYSKNTHDEDPKYPHLVWVLDGFRYAVVKKTVAYILVDEDEYGNDVLEKWSIKQHREYAK